MKPEAVIIGGGLWFLRDKLRDFEGYRTALQELLTRSMEIFIKVTTDRVDSNFQPCLRANGSAISTHDSAKCKQLLEVGTMASGIHNHNPGKEHFLSQKHSLDVYLK